MMIDTVLAVVDSAKAHATSHVPTLTDRLVVAGWLASLGVLGVVLVLWHGRRRKP